QILYNNLKAIRLFANVQPLQTMMLPVGCQPGWYVLVVENETFLLSPTTGGAAFSSLEQGLIASAPLLETSFAIMNYKIGSTSGSITPANSNNTYAQLVTENIIKDGRLTTTDSTKIYQALT